MYKLCIELKYYTVEISVLKQLMFFLFQNLNGNDRGDKELEGFVKLEGSLLPEHHVPFILQTPSPMPAYLNVHYICESASRLLFLSVHWVRNIPAFQLFR